MALIKPFRSAAIETLANGRKVFYPAPRRLNDSHDGYLRSGFYVNTPEDEMRVQDLLQWRKRVSWLLWSAFILVWFGLRYATTEHVGAMVHRYAVLIAVVVTMFIRKAEDVAWKQKIFTVTSHLEKYESITLLKDLIAERRAQPGYGRKAAIWQIAAFALLFVLAWFQLLWLPRDHWHHVGFIPLLFTLPVTLIVLLICLSNLVRWTMGDERFTAWLAGKNQKKIGQLYLLSAIAIMFLAAYLRFWVFRI